jgi:DNA-binding response OmpR family regulator
LLSAGVILVIEDEQSIANVVRIALERDGRRVICVRTGEEGLAELPRHRVDLVVLDIGLPGMDGLEVCRRIRADSPLPIIMLTARDEEADRVAGLELGADDYVPKPFSPRELAARVKAVLRRSTAAPCAQELALADVRLSRPRHEVHAGGRPVELTATEFELLAFFMENPGLLFSREVLLDRVWGLDYPGGTRTVDQHVAQVRAKLGRPELIDTVRGAGYKAVRQ